MAALKGNYTGTITHTSNTVSTIGVTTLPAVGDFVAVFIKASGTNFVASVTDTKGNYYLNSSYSGESGPDVELWSCNNITVAWTSGNVITATLSGGTNELTDAVILDFSGVVSNALDDANNSYASTSNASSIAMALNENTSSPSLVIAAVGTGGASSQTFSNGAGFSAVISTSQMGVGYRFQTVVNAAGGTFDWTTAAPNVGIISAFNETAYTVTFNGNGSTGGSTANETAYIATNLTANGFTKTGYYFSGWNTAANGSGTAYADDASYAFNASITLYAQWAQYTVTFNANGGTGSATQSYDGAEDLTAFNGMGISYAGHTFTGWNTAANGSGTAYADEASYNFTAAATLYAQWVLNLNHGSTLMTMGVG